MGLLERLVGARRKVLHVFPSFARGGQQTRFAAIATASSDRLEHHVVSLDGDVTAADAAPSAFIETLKVAKSPAISRANLHAINGMIRRLGPDLLCTYNFGSIEAVLANALGARIPHIHHEDGFGRDESERRQKWRRIALRRITLGRSLVVVPSTTLEETALRRWGLLRARVRRIANGVDTAKFRSDGRSAGGDPLLIGAVGALRPEKNFARLIRIFAGLQTDFPLRLEIVGGGPESDRLRLMATGMEGRFSLPGETTAPEKAYRRFDIFALSSDTEQMPLSLMEAMAAGLPVAATDVGDVRSMVAPANRAFVTPPEDEAAFGRSLRSLASDAGLRRDLGAANAAKAEREFSLSTMITRHLALYEEALEGGGL